MVEKDDGVRFLRDAAIIISCNTLFRTKHYFCSKDHHSEKEENKALLHCSFFFFSREGEEREKEKKKEVSFYK